MASVSRRADRTGWEVRWRDESKKQRKKTFRRKLAADRFRAEIEHQLNTGAYIDPSAGRTPFRDYAEAWRVAQPVRPNTAARHQTELEHAYVAFGSRPLAAIRPSEVQAFVTGLGQRLAPGSVRSAKMTVCAVFRAALRDRLIGRTPCEALTLPAAPVRRVVPLTVEEVEALASAMPERYQALVVVGAGVGLRRGELLGLQVRDVDFLRRQITVERQVQRGAASVGMAPLKNRTAYRTVPVGDMVLTTLAEHLRRWPAGPEDHVFRSARGGLVRPSAFGSTVWRPARLRAGLPEVTIHDLRHFYASALIRGGLSVKAVSERLGHASASVTLNVYAHLWPDDEDRTRQAIDDLFAGTVPQLRPAKGGEA